MSQPLILKVFQNKESKKSLASVYFHWGAYFEPALNCCRYFINSYDDNLNILEVLYNAFPKSGISSEEKIDAVPSGVEFKPAQDRIEGIIALSNDLQDKFDTYACGIAYVYIDEQIVDVYTLCDPISFEEWESEYEEVIPEISAEFNDFTEVPWDAVDVLRDEIQNAYLSTTDEGYVLQPMG